ncbi:MAG: hypothetical protein NTV88_00035, partial [Candidatus Micrarchaeota archaeon]|nr:hypothetical protein [Candidatus Micrarchaeota archaeon]
MAEGAAAQGYGSTRSMSRQKILANLQMLSSDEKLSTSILVALGTLFLLLCFTFYPIYLVPILAA